MVITWLKWQFSQGQNNINITDLVLHLIPYMGWLIRLFILPVSQESLKKKKKNGQAGRAGLMTGSQEVRVQGCALEDSAAWP